MIYCWILLRRNVWDKFSDTISTHILCSTFFFINLCCLWDNVIKFVTTRQATDNGIIWRTRFACRMTKATSYVLYRIGSVIFYLISMSLYYCPQVARISHAVRSAHNTITVSCAHKTFLFTNSSFSDSKTSRQWNFCTFVTSALQHVYSAKFH
jgi:hypothetical protein